MCIGYDPFKWADNFNSYEEYYKELLEENDTQNNQNKQSDGMVEKSN